jgi:hypothetical protein
LLRHCEAQIKIFGYVNLPRRCNLSIQKKNVLMIRLPHRQGKSGKTMNMYSAPRNDIIKSAISPRLHHCEALEKIYGYVISSAPWQSLHSEHNNTSKKIAASPTNPINPDHPLRSSQ